MTDLPSDRAILQVLAPISDPQQGKSLVELNMIRDVVVKPSGVVSFTLVLANPNSPHRDTIIDKCKTAIKALDGVTDVWAKVISDSPATNPNPVAPPKPGGDRMAIPGIKHIIAVSSGKGGVGKTTVSVNLAVGLAEMGAKVGILDADIYGPNVPLMLGMDDFRFSAEHISTDANGMDVVQPAFNYGVKIVSRAFTHGHQPLPWRGPMLHGIIRQFLTQVNWGELDYLIVDMPPGTGDAQMTLIQSVATSGAVIVTTPQNVSLLDSYKGLQMFENMGVPILGIVENMSYFIPPDMPDKQYDIFGSGGGTKTASELGIPLLGCVPLEIGLREGGDRGVPITLSHPESASAQALKAIAQAVASKIETLGQA
ncbi:Mrp/NBP35 family ATP-binding protein [Pseudanabaena sp. PCC 6802]|uniref:Mrp/NBP35 family ATP-binding protein n=1 Tax=Pseudanabaena sp. PCC 6802 TaxID=118173 RepID=UPI00034A402E|nr:Mrp/NBP35 family ATP-binding protein [Pseudanabaena sp. PCC 6802]